MAFDAYHPVGTGFAVKKVVCLELEANKSTSKMRM